MNVDEESKYAKRTIQHRNKIIGGVSILACFILFCLFFWDTTSTSPSPSTNLNDDATHAVLDESSQMKIAPHTIISSPHNNNNKNDNSIDSYDIWKSAFSFNNYGFWRTYISTTCHFAYFTTLKTASMTTRKLINNEECGLSSKLISDRHYWYHCGDHECQTNDLKNLKNSNIIKNKLIFIRNPLYRLISVYNHLLKRGVVEFPKQWYLDNFVISGNNKNNNNNGSNSLTEEEINNFDLNVLNKDVNNVRANRLHIHGMRPGERENKKEEVMIKGTFLEKFDRFRIFLSYLREFLNKNSDYYLEISKFAQMHLQAQYLSMCMYNNIAWMQHGGENVTCFEPTFVGKVETLDCDLEYIFNNDNEMLGYTINDKNKKKIESNTHKTPVLEKWSINPKKDIEKFDLDTLLLICQIYWNDFQCFKNYYDIPKQCVEYNKKYNVWKKECVDLKNVPWQWPDDDRC